MSSPITAHNTEFARQIYKTNEKNDGCNPGLVSFSGVSCGVFSSSTSVACGAVCDLASARFGVPAQPRMGLSLVSGIDLGWPQGLGLGYTYPDNIGSIDVRLRREECAKWVPKVIKKYDIFGVGTGFIKDERCGRFKPLGDDTAGACPNHPNEHKPYVLPIGCKRRDCPEDYTRWSHQQARRLSNVVNGYLNAKFRNQLTLIPGFVPRYLPDHISIHPPRRLVVELVRRAEKSLKKKGILLTDYHVGIEFHRIFQKKYRYEEKKALTILGMHACSIIYHSIRLKRDDDAADIKSDSQHDTGRYRAVLDKKNWRDGVIFSPHSHIITDGSFLMNANEFYEKTDGWTYRNHREISDIENLAKYLLSHADATPGCHSIRHLGDYQKLNREGTYKVDTFVPCPECLKEGIPESEATYVVGKLINIEYDRDKNNRTRPVTWDWGEIYGKRYVKRTRIIPIFRLRPFGLPRVAVEREGGKPVTVSRASWLKLPESLQRCRRWIEHFSQEEWLAYADKPNWWV
jgi:hypothetical protein